MRPIRLILTLSTTVLGLVLIAYALDRGGKREDSLRSSSASSETTSVVSRVATEQAAQGSRHQIDAMRAPQNVTEPGSMREWDSSVRQLTREQTAADSTVAPPKVVAAYAGHATDISVVGRPFPVSGSVVEACKAARRDKHLSDACDRASELLTEIAREPRDEVWATATEKVLRGYAEEDAGKFTIRALECRKSICFIETASIFEGLPDPGYRSLRHYGLKKEYPVDVHETDDAGVRLTVTLFPFTRI